LIIHTVFEFHLSCGFQQWDMAKKMLFAHVRLLAMAAKSGVLLKGTTFLLLPTQWSHRKSFRLL